MLVRAMEQIARVPGFARVGAVISEWRESEALPGKMAAEAAERSKRQKQEAEDEQSELAEHMEKWRNSVQEGDRHMNEQQMKMAAQLKEEHLRKLKEVLVVDTAFVTAKAITEADSRWKEILAANSGVSQQGPLQPVSVDQMAKGGAPSGAQMAAKDAKTS